MQKGSYSWFAGETVSGVIGPEAAENTTTLGLFGEIVCGLGTETRSSSLTDVLDSEQIELTRDSCGMDLVLFFPCADSKRRTLCMTWDRITEVCCLLLDLLRRMELRSSATFTKVNPPVVSEAAKGVWLDSFGESVRSDGQRRFKRRRCRFTEFLPLSLALRRILSYPSLRH